MTPDMKETLAAVGVGGITEPERVADGIQLLGSLRQERRCRPDHGHGGDPRRALERARGSCSHGAICATFAPTPSSSTGERVRARHAARPDARRTGGNRPRHHDRGVAAAAGWHCRRSSSPATPPFSRAARDCSAMTFQSRSPSPQTPRGCLRPPCPACQAHPPSKEHPAGSTPQTRRQSSLSIRRAVELVHSGRSVRRGDQSDQQEGAERRRVSVSRPHGVPRRARCGAFRDAALPR